MGRPSLCSNGLTYQGVPSIIYDMARYEVNDRFLENPESWSEEQAYFFGWLVSDGTRDGYGRSIGFRLAESDWPVLEILKSLVGYTGPVRFEKRHQVVSNICGRSVFSNQDRSALCIYNRKLAEDARSLGIVSTKATNFVIPQINPSSFCHFVRGLFDGDGCFSFSRFNKFEASLVGAQNMLESIVLWTNRYDINPTFNPNVFGNGARTLRISGNNTGMRLFPLLYDGCKYYLERKIEAFVKLYEFKSLSNLKTQEKPLFDHFESSLVSHASSHTSTD